MIDSFSELANLTKFVDGPSSLNAWGNFSSTGYMWPPSNGTYSAGNFTNYNNPVIDTTLDWKARVPAGTPEGLYSQYITYKAEIPTP